MDQFRLVMGGALVIFWLGSVACGGARTAPAEVTSEEGSVERTFDESFERFDPENFADPTNIDNQWLPLRPGIKLIFAGTTTEDGETFDHRIELTVTDLTKEIMGVRTLVVWIEDFSDDELVEAEIAFYAQDNDGNVWFLGEYPEEYEDGELISALTWIAGQRSARPGIAMQANPQENRPSYSQGYGPEIHWSDRAQVVQMNQSTCVAVDCYQDVLIIEEFNRTEPNAFQLKYYAPGVGNVRVSWRGDDATQEELELVEQLQLDALALREVNEATLWLEKSAYQNSPGVYGHTTPIDTDIILEAEFIHFDANNFDDPTAITNEWLPLQPGTQWILDGIAFEDNEAFAHRIEFAVTDLTKEIAGVQTVVAWIEDFSDGELVEAEIAFYAQDNDGNVWFFGEHPEEYEDGVFVAAPTWIAGVENALPGLKMMADPQEGTEAYFQGWGPAVDWTDYGQVDQVGEQFCVVVDCYDDVLIIAESSLDELNAYQLKFYARGVGNIGVGWRGEDATREELELVSFTQLDEKALRVVRQAALAMEAHAYTVSKVYAQTNPIGGP